MDTASLWLLILYQRISTIAEPYITQAIKTVEAVRKSFHPEAIECFYEGIPIPVPYGSTVGSLDYGETPKWYYCEQTFFEQISDFEKDGKTLPWLAADILCDGKKVADITDFIQGLRYVGALPPTPDYILGVWSYKNNYLLKRSHTQLVVIDSEGETHSFNFSCDHLDKNDSSWLRSLGV